MSYYGAEVCGGGDGISNIDDDDNNIDNVDIKICAHDAINLPFSVSFFYVNSHRILSKNLQIFADRIMISATRTRCELLIYKRTCAY